MQKFKSQPKTNQSAEKSGNNFWKNKSILLTIIAGLIFVIVVYSINYKTSDNATTKEDVTKIENSVAEKNLAQVSILNDANFEKEISKGIVVVDFWATWCRPCRIQGPIMDELAKDLNGKAKIAKLDVDANQIVSNKYSIFSIPTIIIFKDGKKMETLMGVQQKESLTAIINKYL